MKRFRFKQTGEPLAVLTLEDAPTPTPGDDEVLVRVLLTPGSMERARRSVSPRARQRRRALAWPDRRRSCVASVLQKILQEYQVGLV
jgi:hypothetical protein